MRRVLRGYLGDHPGSQDASRTARCSPASESPWFSNLILLIQHGLAPGKKRYVSLFYIAMLARHVNKNDTVSFYLLSDQICINCRGSSLPEPSEIWKLASKMNELKENLGDGKASGRRRAAGAPAEGMRGRSRRAHPECRPESLSESGFEGAASTRSPLAARAGKPTIYARFGDKRALFTAVVMRDVCPEDRAVQHRSADRRNDRTASGARGITLLDWILDNERMALMRLAIAEANASPISRAQSAVRRSTEC